MPFYMPWTELVTYTYRPYNRYRIPYREQLRGFPLNSNGWIDKYGWLRAGGRLTDSLPEWINRRKFMLYCLMLLFLSIPFCLCFTNYLFLSILLCFGEWWWYLTNTNEMSGIWWGSGNGAPCLLRDNHAYWQW